MKKKLHILFLSSWYPTLEQPFLGNFVKRHAELIAQNHQVTVINLQAVETKPISLKNSEGNLTEIFVQYANSRNPLVKWKNARKEFKASLEQIKDIDLIHGNLILTKGLQFIWAKKHFSKPLIVTEHASYFQKSVSDKWSWKEKMVLRKVMKAADSVTAVSPFLKEEMQIHFPEKEIKIFSNVIDSEKFIYKPKTKHEITKFIHVSTLDERYKNVQGILSACQLLKEEKGAVFTMKIISDEPFQILEERVRIMKLDDCVLFSGPAQPAEIAEEMQTSDAFVLFSNYETFSIVIAEAWATGTPIVSTSVGIAKDLDSQVGIQVEIGNVERLKEALQQFVEGKVNFDGKKIRVNAQKYFPEEILKTIEKIYYSLL